MYEPDSCLKSKCSNPRIIYDVIKKIRKIEDTVNGNTGKY